MRPCTTVPMAVRGAAFGGPAPLICVPLVGRSREDLLAQAAVARTVGADVIEWRADFYDDVSPDGMRGASEALRQVVGEAPIIYTLRMAEEGGARPLALDLRGDVITAVIRSRHVDIVDIELRNGSAFIEQVADAARAQQVRVILSAHDFQSTPAVDALLDTVSKMVAAGADIAKFACMPQTNGDVLRLLEATSRARTLYPSLPLCTMSMGSLGVPTRAAGFLFGSDMTFAVGQTASAPGQIPIAELRAMIDGLLRYA